MRSLSLLISIVFVTAIPSVSMATYVNLNSNSMTGLLGGSWNAVGSPMSTEMDSATLEVTATSQAFTNGTSYVYLYQLANTGTSGYSSVELFTIAPFAANGVSDLGILAGSVPDGFTVGGNNPGPQAKVAPIAGGDVLSFYFIDILGGNPLPPSQNSSVLYVASQFAPSEIYGNVIDGTIASGNVVGPVPEPATMSLLAIGGMALLRRKK